MKLFIKSEVEGVLGRDVVHIFDVLKSMIRGLNRKNDYDDTIKGRKIRGIVYYPFLLISIASMLLFLLATIVSFGAIGAMAVISIVFRSLVAGVALLPMTIVKWILTKAETSERVRNIICK